MWFWKKRQPGNGEFIVAAQGDGTVLIRVLGPQRTINDDIAWITLPPAAADKLADDLARAAEAVRNMKGALLDVKASLGGEKR